MNTMKIAHFVTGFPLLSETFILNQITGLIDQGHQVDIFTAELKNQSVAHDDVIRYGLADRAYCHGNFAPKAPSNKLTRFLRVFTLPCTHFKTPLPLLKSMNVLRFGKDAVALNTIYKAAAFTNRGLDSYDIVHCHFGPNGNLGAFLKYTGIIKGKLLTTFYGYDISKYVKMNGPEVYRLLFDQCDKVYSLCQVMKNQLIELGCSEAKAEIHRLGITTNRFAFSPRYKKENGRIDLFTPARLVEKKGLKYAIQGVARLVDRFPGLNYKIAGDGILKNELEALINDLGVQREISILGWKNQEEIIALLNEADILLAPSVTASDGDQEGTPTVLLEALAQGLPVVSTYHSGIPEVVEDGKSGYLVPERDIDALAEKLTLLIEDHESWGAMGRAGREKVEKYYDIEKLNEELVRSYADLISNGTHVHG